MFGNSFLPMAMQQAGFSALDMMRQRLPQSAATDPYDGMNYKPSTPPNSLPPKLNGPASPVGGANMGGPAVAQDLNAPDNSPLYAPPMVDTSQFSNGVELGRATAPMDLKRKGGMFGSGTGKAILTALAYGINGYLAGRGNPAGIANLNAMNSIRDRQMEYAQRMRELQAKQYLPQQVGDSMVQLGQDGQFHAMFRDPQPFEAYALSQDLAPGSDGFKAAVRDFRLGPWSDPAMAAKQQLEGIRYGYRDDLQDQRLTVTRRGQDLNHQDRQASIAQSNTNNIRSTGVSRSNAQLRADTQRGAHSYTHGSGGKGGKGADSIPDGTIIKNPSTGQRMKRQGGQWVPIS